MTQYFRIKAYYPKEEITFTVDSYGCYDKLWQFSAFLVSKGCKVLDVSKDEQVDASVTKKLTAIEPNKIVLRSIEVK